MATAKASTLSHRRLYPVQLDTNHSEEHEPKPQDRSKSQAVIVKEGGVRVFERVELPGITQLRMAQSVIVRVFWLVLCIVCIVLAIVGVVRNAINYYQSPIATTYTINTPAEIDFPDIYICFGNAISNKYATKDNATLKKIDFLYKSFNTQDKNATYDKSERLKLENGTRQFGENDTTYKFSLNAAFPIETTFLQCVFHGYTDIYHNCSDVITPVLDPTRYTCFVIRMPDAKQVKADKGVSLLINSQVDDYLSIPGKTDKPAGLLVSIDDTYDINDWYYTVVRPGTMTKITLSATNVQLLNLKRGNVDQHCLDDGRELYQIFNTTYSRTTCQLDCQMRKLLEICGCITVMEARLIRDDIVNTVPFCTSNLDRACVGVEVTNSAERMNEVKECAMQCGTPCNSTRYKMRSSSAKLADGIQHAVSGKKTNVSSNRLIKLDIALGRIEIAQLIQAQSKTWAQTISDFGGTLNLWIGASLVVMIQVIGSVTVYGCYYCWKRYHRLLTTEYSHGDIY